MSTAGERTRGKLFFAANPWPLAARAKEEGLRTDQFRESDLAPEGIVYVVDLDALYSLGWALPAPDRPVEK